MPPIDNVQLSAGRVLKLGTQFPTLVEFYSPLLQSLVVTTVLKRMG